jgi:hypothetical protein
MKITLAAIALAALAAAGSAHAAPRSHQQCFYARNVNGFTALSDRVVNVRVGVGDIYQFELMTPCPDLRWNEGMGLISRGSDWICSGIDAEVVSHTPIGPQRCPVSHIHKLTPAEIAALPKRARP